MAHPEADRLLTVLIERAQALLKKHGKFVPFGATLDERGEIAIDFAYVEEELVNGQALIDALVHGFREAAKQGRMRAGAVCADTSVRAHAGRGATDAIMVSLDHCESGAATVYLPYRRGLLGRIRYEELFGVQSEWNIFD